MSRKWNSIKQTREYKLTIDTGQKFITKSFISFLLPSVASEMKLGIIASKKVGKAVMRNKCKRLIRACFTDITRDFDASVNIVFIVRKDLLKMDYKLLSDGIKKAIQISIRKIPNITLAS